MSRPIKFRVWNYTRDEMSYDIESLDFGHNEIHQINTIQDRILFPDKEAELMQYTGLKSEGAEIYEGDILGIDHAGGKLEPVGEVIFDTDFAQFTIKYRNGGWSELWIHLEERTNTGKEVIGNIYENPELVEKSDE